MVVNSVLLPDRIETGSYLAAAAITGGKSKLHTQPTLIMESVLDKFEKWVQKSRVVRDWIELDMRQAS